MIDPKLSDGGEPGGAFPSTHWSVVVRAGDAPSPESARALAELCAVYWPAVYGFLRQRGHRPEDAEDLTQEFLARLLEKSPLSRLDPARGSFRSFLLACLRNFEHKEWARDHREKRGGKRARISIDAVSEEERLRLEPADSRTPEKLFEQRWALSVLDAARLRLRSEFAAARKLEVFEHLECFIDAGGRERPYEETARALGKSAGAVKVAVHRLRQRYGELVREEVLHTVGEPEQVGDELRQLLAALRA